MYQGPLNCSLIFKKVTLLWTKEYKELKCFSFDQLLNTCRFFKKFEKSYFGSILGPVGSNSLIQNFTQNIISVNFKPIWCKKKKKKKENSRSRFFTKLEKPNFGAILGPLFTLKLQKKNFKKKSFQSILSVYTTVTLYQKASIRAQFGSTISTF